MNFWQGKKVLVTGGAGFIGSHLTEKLLHKNAVVRILDNLSHGTLENLSACRDKIEFVNGDMRQLDTCRQAARGCEVVMHLAARVGGVGYNVAHQGTMFTENVLLSTNMMEAARLEGVQRYLCVSSACVYPRFCTIPTKEEEGFKDEPEPTNLGYGWAKRIAEIQARTYIDEFRMNIAIVRPYNSYGPRDHFEPEKAHVIPSLINKISSGQDPLVVWGDGLQTRAFVYVTDIAEGMMLAIEKGVFGQPLNIGTEEEITIKALAELLIKLYGRSIRLKFDATHLGGQPRRNADISKAKQLLGYAPAVTLEQGLAKTIAWHRQRT
ncbi:MAG TPA: NAD-dependent epimerase/dehydratase family protein [Patescibacteria group bacterium]|nr:NAD-dependent epimerase/dehydratase family protein [Patescibacteria group bacterium]